MSEMGSLQIQTPVHIFKKMENVGNNQSLVEPFNSSQD